MALTGTAPIAGAHPFRGGWLLAWGLAGAAFVALWLLGSGWPVTYPKPAQIPAMRWVGDLMKWLVNDASFGLFSFVDVTRFIATVIELPYWVASSLFATGVMTMAGSSGVQIVPPVSWIAVIGTLGLIGHWAGGWRLALLTVALMLFIALFGQWTAAMVTLASIVIVTRGDAGAAARGARLSRAAGRAGDHAAARLDADRAGVQLTSCRCCSCSASGRWRRSLRPSFTPCRR